MTQLMEKQRLARTASLNKQLECGCPDSTAAGSSGEGGKPCVHQQQALAASQQQGNGGHGHGRKVQATKSEAHTTRDVQYMTSTLRGGRGLHKCRRSKGGCVDSVL